MTTKPSAAASERAREIVGTQGRAVYDFDGLRLRIASELSAKDAEIERLKTESDERHDLLSKERRANDSARHQLLLAESAVEALTKRRDELRTKLTTARADAVRECATYVKDHYLSQHILKDDLLCALESLLNESDTK